jgi:hypothetical protein
VITVGKKRLAGGRKVGGKAELNLRVYRSELAAYFSGILFFAYLQLGRSRARH